MSETKTFYEVKTFRLLGSSYIKMITNDRFDIASLIPAEMVDIGVQCSLEQLLEHGFFHADPHPGNLLALDCLLYTSPSPRDATLSRMPSSA